MKRKSIARLKILTLRVKLGFVFVAEIFVAVSKGPERDNAST